MPFTFFGDTSKQYPADSFTVALTSRRAHDIHFENHSVFLGGRLLTEQEQKKLLADYTSAYRLIRQRNYGWRLLSFVHDYFNGQLQDIRSFPTDEQKLRYLFHHAEKTPHSKTAEALTMVLPIFSDTLQPTLRYSTNVQKKLVSMAKADITANDDTAPKSLQSEYPARYMRWVEDCFHQLWKYPVIAKAASVQYEPRNSTYVLFFYTNIKAAIEKTISHQSRFFSNNKTVVQETAECEWAKKLYDGLVYFRHRVYRANGVVSEIHAAFNEFILAVHADPPDLYSAKCVNGDFHELVKLQRIQLIVIHQEWLTTMDNKMDHASAARAINTLQGAVKEELGQMAPKRTVRLKRFD